MRKRYCWKVLLDGGVLVEPGEIGNAEEGKEPFNGYKGSFPNESEAHARFHQLIKNYEYDFVWDGQFVLVEFYEKG